MSRPRFAVSREDYVKSLWELSAEGHPVISAHLCRELGVSSAAVSKALDRAGFAIVSTGLKQCLTNGDELDSVLDRLQILRSRPAGENVLREDLRHLPVDER